MVKLVKKYEEELRANLSKTIKDPFHIELIVVLDKIHNDLHYAEVNREMQTKEIIGELQSIKRELELKS